MAAKITLPIDEFVPDPVVCREFHITIMTLWRWSHNQKMGFPPQVKVGGRNYRSRQALETFKAKALAEAIEARDATWKAA